METEEEIKEKINGTKQHKHFILLILKKNPQKFKSLQLIAKTPDQKNTKFTLLHILLLQKQVDKVELKMKWG